MPGPFIGRYDPVKATVYKPKRTNTTSGEPKDNGRTEICKRYLTFKTQNSGQEPNLQTQLLSTNRILIRFRDDVKTRAFMPSYIIVHRGVSYGIIAPNPIDFATGEVEFICQAIFPST